MSVRGTLFACLLLGSALAAPACSTGPELDLTLDESPRGAVYLQRIPDRAFQAAHPIKIAPATIALVLRGVWVRSDQGVLHNLVAGKTDPLRAFTDDEVAYLAPLIADGLSRAAADQQVGFRIIQAGAPGYSQSVGAGVGSSEPPLSLAPSESTSGVMYAHGRSLHLTVTEYRRRPESAATINMANRRIPDSTGLVNRTVLFTPESARRPDSFRLAHSLASTLVIDYELLASLPAGSDQPTALQAAPAPGTPRPNASPKEGPAQRDAEIEALRKELQEIKRRLAEQEAERIRSQPRKPVAPR